MAKEPIIIPSEEDIQANRNIAIFSYLGFLFLIPMLAKKDSVFCRYHVNQGIILFILDAAISILSRIIPFLGILGIGPLILMLLGIINCVNGQTKPLPVIGDIEIYK